MSIREKIKDIDSCYGVMILYTQLIQSGECTKNQFSIRTAGVLITQEIDGEEEPDKYWVYKRNVTPTQWNNFIQLIQDMK